MKINTTGISYNFDPDTGNTTSIAVTLRGFDSGESASVTTSLTGDGLDSMTKPEMQAKAMARAASFFSTDNSDNAAANTETNEAQSTASSAAETAAPANDAGTDSSASGATAPAAN